MAKGKKVYAVKYGFDNKTNEEVRNLIVDNWNECSRLVRGVKGAQYKSFEDLKLAEEYLDDKRKLLKKGIDFYPEDILQIYVDGSYNVNTEKFGYGLVAVKNNVIEYVEKGASSDNSQKQLRQILGELEAALKAVEYGKSKNCKELIIIHDYEGIYHHAMGTWQRKDESSKKYYDQMNKYMKEENINIIFVKVDSHTGDIFNEITDSMAKSAINVPLTDAVDGYLNNNNILVKDESIKKKLLSIIKNKNEDKIIIEDSEVDIINNEEKLDEEVYIIEEKEGNDNDYIDNYINELKNLSLDKKQKFLKRLKKDELINIILKSI